VFYLAKEIMFIHLQQKATKENYAINDNGNYPQIEHWNGCL
jgi:hypothetical protein